MNRFVSRRLVLRGAAGVALTLPWLESLLPTKSAQAQAVTAPKRYMPIFLPNGASENWKPLQVGVGTAWTMSPVFELFSAALKAKMSVLSNFENGSAFNPDGSSDVEPSHGRQPGAFLTCVDPSAIRKALKVAEANAISLDQIMATHAAFKDKTRLPSLQLGLSTVLSYCDGQPCSNSRSVSWSGATTPMYKQVDPLEVFNKIVGVIKQSDNMGGNTAPDPEALNNIARNKSVIDAVLESATHTQAQLGTADKLRLQEFLDAVRTVEKNVTGVSMGMGGVACSAIATPTMATVRPDAPKQNGSNHACNDLPVALIGGGALGLKQDQHVALGKRPLRDLHYTMMNKVFDMSDVATFGQDLTGAQLKVVSEIIA